MNLRVEWHTFDERKESASSLEKYIPQGVIMSNIFGIADDGRLLWADYTGQNLKSGYYEGCAASVDVTNLLLFYCSSVKESEL